MRYQDSVVRLRASNSLAKWFAAAALSTALMVTAQADPYAFDIDNEASPASDSRDFMLGYEFTVTGSVTIDGLGIFDLGSNGLVGGVQVGLWTSSGTLLASTVVTSSSTASTSLNTSGQWLFEDISSLTLGTGSYVAAMLRPGNTDAWMFSSGGPAYSDPSFTYGNVLELQTSTFQIPTTVLSDYGHWGPNLRLATSVPDGGLTALLLVCSLGAAVTVRRKLAA